MSARTIQPFRRLQTDLLTYADARPSSESLRRPRRPPRPRRRPRSPASDARGARPVERREVALLALGAFSRVAEARSPGAFGPRLAVRALARARAPGDGGGPAPALEPVPGRRRTAARQLDLGAGIPARLARASLRDPAGLEPVSPPSRPPRGGRRVPVAEGSRAVASFRRPRRDCLRAFFSFHRVARAPSDADGSGCSPPAALRRAPRGTSHARRFRRPRRRDIRRYLRRSSRDRAPGGSPRRGIRGVPRRGTRLAPLAGLGRSFRGRSRGSAPAALFRVLLLQRREARGRTTSLRLAARRPSPFRPARRPALASDRGGCGRVPRGSASRTVRPARPETRLRAPILGRLGPDSPGNRLRRPSRAGARGKHEPVPVPRTALPAARVRLSRGGGSRRPDLAGGERRTGSGGSRGRMRARGSCDARAARLRRPRPRRHSGACPDAHHAAPRATEGGGRGLSCSPASYVSSGEHRDRPDARRAARL